jgi:predicted lipoprotein
MHRHPPSPARGLVALLAASAVLALGSCSGADDATTTTAPVDREDVVARIAEEVIVPGYEQLATTTDALAVATAELCATPEAGAFESARDAWDAAQGAWASTAAYRLGPIRPLRLTARIEYPVDVDKIDELAADDAQPAPVTPEALAGSGADVRGLNAVQHLLFTPTDVGQLSARQCAYAASAAQLSADGAAELLAAWVDGVDGAPPAVEQLSNPGGDSMWESSTEALEDLLNTSLSALTTVTDMQLGPATGETTEAPEPQVVDDGAAHRALADVADELGSVSAVYGDSSADPSTGLAALVAAAGGATSDEAIRADLADAIAAVAAVPPPLFDIDPADTEGPAMASLVDAYDHSLAARTALGTEVASLLGLTISFSDSDGDG